MYKRIILKLSGETLAPEHIPENKNASLTFDAARVDRAAAQAVQVGRVLRSHLPKPLRVMAQQPDLRLQPALHRLLGGGIRQPPEPDV